MLDKRRIREHTLSDRDREALKGLIPLGEKPPLEYNDMIQEKKEKKVKNKNIEAKYLLLQSIEYYDKHYPKTKINLVWKGTKQSIKIGKDELELDKELKKLSEEDLFGIQAVYDYCHDERFITTIPDHDKMNYVLAKINQLIPGFQDKVKLKKLLNQESLLQQQKRELQENIKKAQKKYEVEHQTIKEFICDFPGCNKVCGNKGGLTRHKRSHEVKEDE